MKWFMYVCVGASNIDLFLRIDVYLFLAQGEIDHIFAFTASYLDACYEYLFHGYKLNVSFRFRYDSH